VPNKASQSDSLHSACFGAKKIRTKTSSVTAAVACGVEAVELLFLETYPTIQS